jgi:hypothetical protein
MYTLSIMQYVTDIPELLEQWHHTKNTDDPSKISLCSDKKVWWKCPIADDHEWQTRTADRTKGIKERGIRGCPYCVGQRVCKSNCLATVFPEIASQWHPTRNGILQPSDFTFGSNKKAWWKCLSNPRANRK